MAHAHFVADTHVDRLADGRYRGRATERWHVFGDAAPNGGYLLAMAARALADTAGQPDPVTVTAHYLRPVGAGTVEITTDVVKTGRRLTTVQASLVQDDQECLRVVGAFGDLDRFDGPDHQDRTPPPLPLRDHCLDLNAVGAALPDDAPLRPPAVAAQFDLLLTPPTVGWMTGQPAGRGEIAGWCRWAGGGPMDSFGLLVVADAFPPAVFGMGLPIGWVPTVELTVHLRQRPADGWLRARFTTDSVTRGLLEEDGEVWDADGNLVALSRQLALAARA